MRHRSQTGSALLIAVIVSFAIAAIAAALLIIGLAVIRGAELSLEERRALYIAESGIDKAIRELNLRLTEPPGAPPEYTDPDGDGMGTLPLTFFDGGTYVVTATPLSGPGDKWSIRSIGVFPVDETTLVPARNAARRGIEVIVWPDVPIPVRSPLNISVPELATDGDETDPDLKKWKLEQKGGSTPLIDGGDRPAIMVDHGDFYTQLMNEIAHDIDHGKTDPSWLVGEPPVSWTGKHGETIEVPVMHQSDMQFNTAFWESVRTGIVDKTKNTLIPSADYTYDHLHTHHGGIESWGTPADPAIVVIDDHLELHHGELSGYGTLIVTDKAKLDIHHATLNWTGTIIVMGSDANDKGKLHNHHGAMTVDGGIFVVGGADKKAEVKIHENHDNSTTINGFLIALSGLSHDDTKIDIKGKSGDITINGLLAAMATDDLKFKLKDHKDGSLTINGAVSLGLTGDRPDDLKFEMKGAASIRYHNGHIESALDKIEDLLDRTFNIPQPYLVRSWRFFNP